MTATTKPTAAVTVTPADLRRFASDPLAFFADVSLVPGGPPFGSIMAPFQREFLSAIAPCLLAVARREIPPMRGAWLEAVKGAGKDSLCALSLLWLLAFSPRPITAQIAADDLGQAGEVKKSLGEWLQANPWLGQRIEIFDRKIVNATTGSQADVLTSSRTSDAGGSHGSRPDLLILNEVSHIENETFAQTLLDNFTKMPNAFAILASNAGHLETFAWKLREMYREDPRWLFIKVTETPPWQSPADIDEAEKRNPPARFQRLYRGIWSTPGGDALPGEQIKMAVVHDCPVFGRTDTATWQICGIGCDLAAGGKHHAAVVVVVGSYRTGKLRVARILDFPPPASVGLVKSAIERLGNAFRTRALFIDPFGASLLAEELSIAGWDVQCNSQHQTVQAAQAAALLQAFGDEVIELGRNDGADELLLHDLQNCRLVEKSYGCRVEFATDEFGHGDRGSALLEVLPSMLRVLGSLPPDVARGTPRGGEDEEVRDTRPEWERKALRLPWCGYRR